MVIRKYIIESNELIGKGTYRMSFLIEEEIAKEVKPGQFVNLTVEGKFLKRPISINDLVNNTMTIIYKVVGKGTEALCQMEEGTEIEVMLPLGNGYNIETLVIAGEKEITLVGGGIGVPPLYLLGKKLIEKGIAVKAIIGFRSRDEVILEEEFKKAGAQVLVTTEDGTAGAKGFVTSQLNGKEYIMACGPEAMLKALKDCCRDGQFSFEERMGCGFGACMGCSCETKYGYKRICKEGPVLSKDEIIWE